MQPKKILSLAMMLFSVLKLSAQQSYDEKVRKYIEQYKDWAIAEQRRSGVPAAITLAQGIHETSAGESELALNANNHFGIKCRREWTGLTYAYTDDAKDECFRKYPSAFQSYKDHSDYLSGSRRYDALFKLSVNDYKGWATGLKRCGYATNPKYALLIIRLVENYNLQQYTVAALTTDYNPVRDAEQKVKSNAGEVVPAQDAPAAALPQTPVTKRKTTLSVSYENDEQPQPVAAPEPEDAAEPVYGQLVKVNGVKAFYARKGAVLLEDAFKYKIRYAKLLEMNDLPDLPLEADMYVYLENKNTKGIHPTHTVKRGETLIQIAQAEALQLKYLKYYNRIAANEEPVAGAVLNLQQYTQNKPETYVKAMAPRETTPAFAGSNPSAVPPGAGRRRSGYISKRVLEEELDTEMGWKKPPVAVTEKQELAENNLTTGKTEPEPKAEAPAEVPATTNAIAVAEQPAESVVSEPRQKTEATTTTTTTQREVEGVSEENAETNVPMASTTVEKKNTGIEATTSAASDPAYAAIKNETAELTVAAEESKTEEPATINHEPVQSQRTEEITYDVVQPAPVVYATSEAPKKEQATLKPQRVPEYINSLPASKTVIKPVPAEKPAVVNAPPKKAVPQMPEEPKNEFDRLKAKLDRVVYAGVPEPATKPSVATTPATTQPETPKKEGTSQELKPSAAAKGKLYTVKKGDTAFSIAKKHNISMKELRDWNHLEFENIKVGQQLRVSQ